MTGFLQIMARNMPVLYLDISGVVYPLLLLNVNNYSVSPTELEGYDSTELVDLLQLAQNQQPSDSSTRRARTKRFRTRTARKPGEPELHVGEQEPGQPKPGQPEPGQPEPREPEPRELFSLPEQVPVM